MKSVVFISGSREIRLNEKIRSRLRNIVKRGLPVVVGDANGADKAVQKYMYEEGYKKVTVFCSGNSCRNNIGEWKTENVAVDSGLKGREFYMQKDRKMAEKADYGFVVWNGKSTGSVANMLELLRNGKKVRVYCGIDKEFHFLSEIADLKKLLDKSENKEKIMEKTRFRETCQSMFEMPNSG